MPSKMGARTLRIFLDMYRSVRKGAILAGHEHVVADVVVRADILARVCDGVHDVRAKSYLGHVRHDAREQRVVERGQLGTVC